MVNGDYQYAMESRGKNFRRYWELFKRTSKISNYTFSNGVECELGVMSPNKEKPEKFVAFMAVGAPCAGMNGCLKAAIQYLLSETNHKYRYRALVIYDGFEGLLKDDIREWTISNLAGLHYEGGIVIGANRTHPKEDKTGRTYQQIKKYKISHLVLIGGWDAYDAANHLRINEEKLPNGFRSVVIPATISANIPLSDIVIGADTALNAICNCCDRIKLSASGCRRRVFIVEVMGKKCGYLATMAGLAVGADAAYIYEEQIKLNDLVENVTRLKSKMAGPIKRGIVVISNGANKNYDNEFFRKLYTEEGKGIFDCRVSV